MNCLTDDTLTRLISSHTAHCTHTHTHTHRLAPHPEWAHWGFPENATDGFVGNPKLHTLNVGGLWSQMWFPCMTNEPVEIVTVNIGPETGYGTGTHDTEFFVADFDVLMPDEVEE